jgi:hypothetical protein
MVTITEQLVKSLKKTPPPTGYVIHSDDKIRGFGVRVKSNGVVSFILNYTVHEPADFASRGPGPRLRRSAEI